MPLLLRSYASAVSMTPKPGPPHCGWSPTPAASFSASRLPIWTQTPLSAEPARCPDCPLPTCSPSRHPPHREMAGDDRRGRQQGAGTPPPLVLEPLRALGALGNVPEIQQKIGLPRHFTTVTIKAKFQLCSTKEEEYHSGCLCQLSSINLHILGINRSHLHLGEPAHTHTFCCPSGF